MKEQYRTGVGLFIIFCWAVVFGAATWIGIRAVAAEQAPQPQPVVIDCSEAFELAKSKLSFELNDDAKKDQVTLLKSEVTLKECLHKLVPLMTVHLLLRKPFGANTANAGKFACIDAFYDIGAAVDLATKTVVSSRVYNAEEGKPHLCK